MTWKIYSHSLRDTDLLNEESLFFLGNGYLGVRGSFEEGYGPSFESIRGTYLNAFHDTINISYGEKLYGFPATQQKMLNVIDAQTIDIYIGDDKEKFAITEGEILDYTRTLHMDKGYSERRIHWLSPSGKEVKLTFQRMVSFIHRELFISKVIIDPVNFNDKVTVMSTVDGDISNYISMDDPRLAAGHSKSLAVKDIDVHNETGYIMCETETSGLQVGCHTSHYLPNNNDIEPDIEHDEQKIYFSYTFDKKKTDAVEIIKQNIYVDTLRHGDDLKERAKSIYYRLLDVEFETLLRSQEDYLKLFWERSDVEIQGEAKLQEGIRFNLFHLLQSSGRDKFSNISAKGLSGEGYEGHYFWDTEIYLFPVFLMTNPELAKQLLIYRYSILEHARQWARTLGHRQGALFPWRTITGEECSSYFPSGSAQYHISADIAYSYIQYYFATHDEQFMLDYGAELLIETARLWMDTGHFRRDGSFAIDEVTGPDEYTCLVNNNYYTNVMAKHNLLWAAKIVERLPKWDERLAEQLFDQIGFVEEEVEAWKRAAENMYLPYDPELDINPQDDSFLHKKKWDLSETPDEEKPLLLHYHPLTLYRYQVCKQADTILAHFLLEDEQQYSTLENTYDYYEKITTHDSSLSSCVFSIMASKLGYMEKAYDYFIETARLDLDNTKGNTKDGLHMANMGGTWMAIVFGFAGLRIKEDGLHMAPQLPDEWESYSFHVQYNHQVIKVDREVNKLVLHLLEGPDLPICVNGEKYTLRAEKDLVIDPNPKAEATE
ncbi:family 65 glycosyl hydrolase [Sediminibacillus dalangtanensis]|uniref:Family 65 glycosyl hydrolase n=1 Tax=Sediminibacillus dalangtanensis TaxID=2729421 RepID=A0ABX7VVE8_9BACI|nr:glycoside hydrolase family 65 protein [Sediminibacillus dalangtanensis]QTN00928.1 family 65 glycosyl hydrolase [Sediminibacillus dalangtanensis]